MPFCAYCRAPVERVSFARCATCGRHTNGALREPASVATGCVFIIAGYMVLAVLVAIDIPSVLTAMQRSKQRRTMSEMYLVGQAFERYAAQHNKQYPLAASPDEVRRVLEPTYLRRVPFNDAWKNAMRYESTASAYFIGSGAKDGLFDRAKLRDYVPYPTTNFNDDIVYSNGSFVQYPEGVQVQ